MIETKLARPIAQTRTATRPAGPLGLAVDLLARSVARNAARRARIELMQLPAERLADAGLTEEIRDELMKLPLSEDPVYERVRAKTFADFATFVGR